MLQIGPYPFKTPYGLAPMAGVTDRPFRLLCKRLGAGFAASEMMTSDPTLHNSRKTQYRMNHTGEAEPRIVQIAGADPDMMANAARYNHDHGAHIIDINMGCPAKKVCNKMAGSALMQDEALAAQILQSVVNAVDIPVTLKMRTGPHPENKNALRIAKIAEDAGIQAIAIHGRTRTDAYKGHAEYDTIAEIKTRIKIPILANGDITNPEQAKYVLAKTAADGLLIGRAAQGNPWIFREIEHYMQNGTFLPQPTIEEIRETLLEHTQSLYNFYGEYTGVRIARKHIGWYLQHFDNETSDQCRKSINRIENCEAQINLLQEFFAAL